MEKNEASCFTPTTFVLLQFRIGKDAVRFRPMTISKVLVGSLMVKQSRQIMLC
jgi:hypothetical protein